LSGDFAGRAAGGATAGDIGEKSKGAQSEQPDEEQEAHCVHRDILPRENGTSNQAVGARFSAFRFPGIA
jgi:hypothetical protein